MRFRQNEFREGIYAAALKYEGILLKSITGPRNETVENIAAKFATAQEMVKVRAREGKRNNAMTKKEREWAINSLSYVACDSSLKKMGDLGIKIGRDLYESTMDFIQSGELIYTTPPENFPGRKRIRGSEKIEEQWIQGSHVVSRTNAAGENLRVSNGGKARVAKSISVDLNCSVATAYRYCPPTVVASRKHSDLCIYCESLRRVRLECIRVANAYGADISELGALAGQNEVRGPGNAAAEYLVDFKGSDGVDELLQNLSTLAWHEALGRNLEASMRANYGKTVICCFDFSSSVKLSSARGDAAEFYRPISLSLFGVMFVVPKSSGGVDRKYVDVFSYNHTHSSKAAIAMLKCGFGSAQQENFIPALNAEISFFSDKAKHFCSGEMAHGVLFDVATGTNDVFYTYHACYHGKTALDAHFGKVKRAIAEIPVERWPHTQQGISGLILKSANHLANTKLVFLGEKYVNDGERAKLIVRDISCVQKFHRNTDSETLVDTLKVEDTEVPIKTHKLTPSEEDEEEAEVAKALETHKEANMTELCDKLLKQKRKLSYYAKKPYQAFSSPVFLELLQLQLSAKCADRGAVGRREDLLVIAAKFGGRVGKHGGGGGGVEA